MQAKSIKIGGYYKIRHNGRFTIVQILYPQSILGHGWVARNIRTGRVIRIKSARKLRCRVPDKIAQEFLNARMPTRGLEMEPTPEIEPE
jgi:hypothetical protein